MRMIIFTMGTRGDIQPYIYLAQGLIEAGHIVTIGTHPCWERLIRESGILFSPIGPDIDIEYEAAVIRGKTKSPLLSMFRTMQFVFKMIEQSSSSIYEGCKGQDLVVVSHSQMGATEAEALGIKTVNVTLQTEMIPETNRKQTAGDKLKEVLINPHMVRPYNKIRKKYNLKPIKNIEHVMSPYLNLIPISQYVIKRNPYWHKRNRVVGYWYNEESNYIPDERLKDFLKPRDKPIILALGAMSFESQEEKAKLDLFVRAFEKMGMRAVIQGFSKTLTDYTLPKTMIAIESVPHNWLFRQGYCVIHHAGFGTSAAAMLAGVPSICIPHVLDQFGVANRLYKLGVSSEPLKVSGLSEEALIGRISELKDNYNDMSACVQDLSSKMQLEDGLHHAVTLINKVLEQE